MKVGIAEYEHEAGECYARQVAELDRPCGDPRCKAALRMVPVKIYLRPCGAPRHCTCAVERNEQGEIVLPDLNQCAFTIETHQAAIARARELLALQPARG